jgi:outer membrane protein OmpA-like peptidoglycan-associated protein
MSYLRTVSCLLAAAFIFAMVGEVEAQKRAHEGLYLKGRLGGAVYGGDRDNNNGEEIWSPGIGDKLSEAGWGLGFEIGTILSRSFTLSLGYNIGKYLEINREDIEGRPSPPIEGGTGPEDFPFLASNSSQIRHTVPLMLTWMIVPKWTLSPYVGAGGHVSFGSYTLIDDTKESKVAYGPSFNLGVDFVVSRRNSIFVDALFHLTFPDFNIDAAGLENLEANQYPYDVLALYGIGLRHSFKPACGPPEITSVDTPARIAIGEAGGFSVMVDDDACQPVDIGWQFGDGESGAGLGANHMFATPGNFTVTVTASNSYGSDSRTIPIEVFDPCPVDAEIIAINTMPGDPIINETITFTADVRGTAPVTYSWDFGDGTTATGARAAHMYTEPGEYTVTLSCSNCGGTDVRTITLRVTEFRCADITELNSVFFDRNSSAIDDAAMGLLNENIEVLTECPDMLVRLDGYSDRGERSPMRLSESRAQAVEQYYIENGISASRLMARGLGRDPLAGKGVDGMRNRRVDSIVVDSFE